MSRRRTDRSIQSSNTPTAGSLSQNLVNKYDYTLRGMIIGVRYVDDPKNPTRGSQNPEVVYDVAVIGGMKEGIILSNVRVSNPVSGQHNFSEVIYRKSTKPIAGPKKVPMAEQNGDLVYIDFVDGNMAAPIIVGGGAHPLDQNNTGATKADGPRYRNQYNGIFEQINKNGEYLLRRKGGTYQTADDFYLPTQNGDEVSLAFTQKKMTRTVDRNSIIEEFDGNIEKMTITFRSGLKVEIDGANDRTKVTTTGGAYTLVDGKSGLIELKDNGTGKLKITGDRVALGASSAELLQQISDELQTLITLFNSVKNHTHDFGNLGYTVGPPTPSFTSDWNTAASSLTTIKGLVDGIKGTL